MLQAMNTGHDGSLTTIHANTPADAIMRLETMVAMSGFELPPATTRAQIGSAINLILQVRRFPDGKRAITSMREITGFDGGQVVSNEIFASKDSDGGEGLGRHQDLEPTGIRPEFLSRLQSYGVEVPDEVFGPSTAQIRSKQAEDAA